MLFEGKLTSCLHIHGDDALRYLDSQMTVSIPEPESRQWRYGLILDTRGKIAADLNVYAQSPESLLVWSQYCPTEILTEAITHHIVADNVEVTDLGDSMAALELVGDLDTIDLPEDLRVYVLEDVNETDDAISIKGNLGGQDQLLFIAPIEIISQIKFQLSVNAGIEEAHPFNSNERELLRIHAGQVAIPKDLSSKNIPQEAKLETHAIDFKKGCFPGQELMAHFRKTGKLTKQLLKFEIEDPKEIDLPSPIYADTLQVGTLSSLAHSDHNSYGLGMLRMRALEKALHVKSGGADIPLKIIS